MNRSVAKSTPGLVEVIMDRHSNLPQNWMRLVPIRNPKIACFRITTGDFFILKKKDKKTGLIYKPRSVQKHLWSYIDGKRNFNTILKLTKRNRLKTAFNEYPLAITLFLDSKLIYLKDPKKAQAHNVRKNVLRNQG
jgi:hypothetical protein